MKKIAVIMAGGQGIKIWPKSTEKYPKQFHHLIGEGTMIQNTVSRLLPLFAPEEIFIVIQSELKQFIIDQLPLVPEENIIIEPFARHTAPCLALTATQLYERFDLDTVMYAFPSDHVIRNVREFHNSLETAGNFAYSNKGLVTIGITPTRPEPGYGYIQVIDGEESEIKEFYGQGVRCTRTFAEKPDVETAKRFIDSGDFLWNSGIFVWRLDTFWDEFRKFLPEHYPLFRLLRKYIAKDQYKDTLENIYRQMQSESIDYAILEKSELVYVVESSFSWSDLGNWDELYRLSLKDARNNFMEGDVIAINAKNCLVSANDKLIGIVGVENLIVIDTDEALLICKRKKSDEVKDLVDLLKRKQINKFL